MSNDVDYFEENTDTGKRKNRLSRMILLAAYLGIWSIALISFWLFTSGSDALWYSVMFLWILLPITTFVVSMIIGKNNYWESRKWFFSIIFGIMYMLAEYGTFSMANMVTFHKINMPEFVMILIGAIISLVGMGIGVGIGCGRSRCTFH
ncbi:MAG: hypothetical protein PHS82_07635 [Lachnospiraceae bacterium]|nr:hypothetical protein [Lachnospiraceae bacterium]